MRSLEEYNGHNNDTPKQRKTKFLLEVSFKVPTGRLASLKGVKVVLKAPYEVLTD